MASSRRKKGEQDSGTPEPKAAQEAEEAKAAAAQEESAEAAQDSPDDAPAEDKPRRRGSAETSAGSEPAAEVPRNEAGAVQVRAQARYVRSAPRKARLVMEHIRGKPVGQARAILTHAERAVASDIAKLLESAVANAENNFELDVDDLRVDRAYVDEGPTLRRYQPRALGRATRINKRTSHMTITLTTASEE